MSQPFDKQSRISVFWLNVNFSKISKEKYTWCNIYFYFKLAANTEWYNQNQVKDVFPHYYYIAWVWTLRKVYLTCRMFEWGAWQILSPKINNKTGQNNQKQSFKDVRNWPRPHKLRSIYSLFLLNLSKNGRSQYCFRLKLLSAPNPQLCDVEVPWGQGRLGGPTVLLLEVADLIWSRVQKIPCPRVLLKTIVNKKGQYHIANLRFWYCLGQAVDWQMSQNFNKDIRE